MKSVQTRPESSASMVEVEFFLGDDVVAIGGEYKGQEGTIVRSNTRNMSADYVTVLFSGVPRIVPRNLLQRQVVEESSYDGVMMT